jgi:16S rRNA G1207 methylase RsmC
MKINPNQTPKGVVIVEIREITQRNSDNVRCIEIETPKTSIGIVALKTVYFSDDFGDSRYFAENLPDFIKGRFLEIGCGTGIITIAAVLAHSDYFNMNTDKYVAIDINQQAVKCTRKNAIINNIEDKVDVRYGDVFQPLKEVERFDCIFWNHPFHKGQKNENIVQRACFDPLFQGFEEYVKNGHKFLNKNGRLLLGSGNFADLDDMRKIVSEHCCEMNLLHWIHRPFEATAGKFKTFNIYEIRKITKKR